MALVDNSPSFRTTQYQQLSSGGEGVTAYVGAGIDGDTPVMVLQSESGYIATALAASYNGIVGVPENGSVATACLGLIRVKGYKAGVQASAGAFGGTAGKAIFWTAATLGGTASAYIGAAGQVAITTETLSASTTANLWFTGIFTTAL